MSLGVPPIGSGSEGRPPVRPPGTPTTLPQRVSNAVGGAMVPGLNPNKLGTPSPLSRPENVPRPASQGQEHTPPKITLPSPSAPPTIKVSAETTTPTITISPHASPTSEHIQKKRGVDAGLGVGFATQAKHDPRLAEAALRELASKRGADIDVDSLMKTVQGMASRFDETLAVGDGNERHTVFRGLLGANELLDMLESGLLRKEGAEKSSGLTDEAREKDAKLHKGTQGEAYVNSQAPIFGTVNVSTTSSAAVAKQYARGISNHTKVWVTLKVECPKGQCIISEGQLERELTFPAHSKIVGMKIHGK